MPARSIAARDAIAPRSIAETDASAPPGSPSPRLPPIHSAIGVRAPETITTSGSLWANALLLSVKAPLQSTGYRRRGHGPDAPYQDERSPGRDSGCRKAGLQVSSEVANRNRP